MNKNELRAEMARHGDTSENIAKLLDISSASFSKKINGKRDFNETEIKLIMNRYSLDADGLMRIFFAH